MTNLRDIRRRLRSVENIKKITDAMERVAAARLKRAQMLAQQSRPYLAEMRGMLEHLSGSEASHPLFEERPVKRSAVIIIAADKGLSGSYNSHLLHEAESYLRSFAEPETELILFGRKGCDYFQGKEWPILYKKTEWGGKIAFHEIEALIRLLADRYREGDLDQVQLIYTHYISVMKREVCCERFFPLGRPASTVIKEREDFIFETPPAKILDQLLPLYSTAKLQGALFDAYAAELAARIVAMQTASRNSENMMEALTLVRNKVRQESITREIIEITR